MQDEDLRRANLLSLAYQAQRLVKHLTDEHAKNLNNTSDNTSRQSLIELFLQAMQQLRKHLELTTEQYFATFNPALDFHQKFDTPLVQADKKQLIAYTVKQLKQTTDKKARAAMLSDATYLLFQFGLQQQAREITLAALDQSIAPYYLMSMMGYFEKELGNDDAALQWYKKAWQAARGASHPVAVVCQLYSQSDQTQAGSNASRIKRKPSKPMSTPCCRITPPCQTAFLGVTSGY